MIEERRVCDSSAIAWLWAAAGWQVVEKMREPLRSSSLFLLFPFELSR